MGTILYPFKKSLCFESEIPKEYRRFLELKVLKGDVWAILTRLNSRNQLDALANLVDRVIQQDPMGKADQEFMVWLGGFFNPKES
jgi:hypothetical protein